MCVCEVKLFSTLVLISSLNPSEEDHLVLEK